MGCGTSVAIENQGRPSEVDVSARLPSPALTMKAAILIQRWYRRYVARLEMRRRYTWNIFQSIEYAGEQDQLQLSSFFSFMLDNFTQLNGNGPDLISHLLDSPVDPVVDEVRQSKYEQIVVPESYSGPRLSFPLSVTDTNVLLSAFKEQQTLHAKYVLQLLHETQKFLKQMPNVIYLSSSYAKEITICGDLHGRLDDLLLIFYKNGLPSAENPYIFNGDFVDRGKKSIEIIIILFAFLLLYPDHMHLNRGNHEDHIMNLRYGFTKEVMQKYKTHGREILQLLQDVFSLLPIATIIDNKVLIVHGGISDKTDLEFLASVERQKVKSALRLPKCSLDHSEVRTSSRSSSRKSGRVRLNSPCSAGRMSHKKKKCRLTKQNSSSSSSSSSSTSSVATPRRPPPSPRLPSPTEMLQVPFLDSIVSLALPEPPREELEWRQIVDVLWSDPKIQNGCSPNSFRGGGCYFGPDVTQNLLKKHGLCLLIRSHECKQEGYELCHNGQVITIFSASNYYEEGSNRGAYIKLGPELIPRFFQYQVSRSTRKLTLQQRVSVAESSALKALQEKLFTHRSELMAFFQQYDINNTGRISINEWAQVLDTVLRLDLPWRTLRPRLVRLASDGNVEYESCFENISAGQPLPQVTPNFAETLYRYRTDLEIIFNIIDKDHSGQISIEEFRQTWKLFSAHLGVDVDDQAIVDMARNIDFNKDGSIDFNEFLEAFRVVHKLDMKEQQQG
ncbi:serine/threonine-protein phosphatase with EF-hands 1 isoform X1 [Astyanax mexicanus]|uniref:serine/threonine-protein phosphatase with EF-hands 1 isoform X1 n=1 Tax=Astyanax mexicanus TaxID=7994 RepID=UPI0020CB1799|nr:serine/threonine-protein phosphatase with EF-hands 1 isoform X1 [Astyanax mexicanus]XP_007259429.3 serine/threonine-protein phosphatase with EF-hands 1 isoform X1 [Astyanax mexicanus]XP_022523932.2 serine/threonine-protein phosphatase with EF-hands 1 isoform X1 [Astyanax mexicanus]